mmetsp:Transcript_12644/g.18968  ORF Transcript_12644/g.18968 Transcript_12644/m.18968 type:complete len:256 (+) Transcript_12644:1108-1875(+)
MSHPFIQHCSCPSDCIFFLFFGDCFAPVASIAAASFLESLFLFLCVFVVVVVDGVANAEMSAFDGVDDVGILLLYPPTFFCCCCCSTTLLKLFSIAVVDMCFSGVAGCCFHSCVVCFVVVALQQWCALLNSVMFCSFNTASLFSIPAVVFKFPAFPILSKYSKNSGSYNENVSMFWYPVVAFTNSCLCDISSSDHSGEKSNDKSSVENTFIVSVSNIVIFFFCCLFLFCCLVVFFFSFCFAFVLLKKFFFFFLKK